MLFHNEQQIAEMWWFQTLGNTKYALIAAIIDHFHCVHFRSYTFKWGFLLFVFFFKAADDGAWPVETPTQLARLCGI